MRRLLALLPGLVALVVTSGAEAKFSSARICGRSDCRVLTVTDRASARRLTAIEAAVLGGSISNRHGGVRPASPGTHPAHRAPVAAPWYRVTLCAGRCSGRYSGTLLVLPRPGYEYLGRAGGGKPWPGAGWLALGDRAAAVYRRITAGLRPLPVSRLRPVSAAVPAGSGGWSMPVWGWTAFALAVAAALLGAYRYGRPRTSDSPPAVDDAWARFVSRLRSRRSSSPAAEHRPPG